MSEDGLIVNEMAPRVHNSGHWSIEGSYSSQFENHVRAICDLPLGSTKMRQPFAAMINIIGKHGSRNTVLSTPNAYLHTYNKTERLNRKIGHINLTDSSAEKIESSIQSLRSFITECG